MDRSANMRPELAVRSLMHRLGYRFQLHKKDLPGKPDLVFVSRRKVLFVHGCFWHSHGCKCAHIPKSNLGYRLPKLRRTQIRDRKNIDALKLKGWNSLTVWECETGDQKKLSQKVRSLLRPA